MDCGRRCLAVSNFVHGLKSSALCIGRDFGIAFGMQATEIDEGPRGPFSDPNWEYFVRQPGQLLASG